MQPAAFAFASAELHRAAFACWRLVGLISKTGRLSLGCEGFLEVEDRDWAYGDNQNRDF